MQDYDSIGGKQHLQVLVSTSAPGVGCWILACRSPPCFMLYGAAHWPCQLAASISGIEDKTRQVGILCLTQTHDTVYRSNDHSNRCTIMNSSVTYRPSPREPPSLHLIVFQQICSCKRFKIALVLFPASLRRRHSILVGSMNRRPTLRALQRHCLFFTSPDWLDSEDHQQGNPDMALCWRFPKVLPACRKSTMVSAFELAEVHKGLSLALICFIEIPLFQTSIQTAGVLHAGHVQLTFPRSYGLHLGHASS